MNKKEKIKQLEKELQDLKEYNRSIWNSYGSELCAGDMISKEEKIEREIEKLKSKFKNEN